jgi:hypothetical protein
MSQPSTSIFFNTTTPAAPAGEQNVVFQSDGATPEQSITAYPKVATTSLLGVVRPDGTTVTIAGGVLSMAGGGTGTTHSESLTDSNSNFIFAGGDIVTVVGVPN